MARGAIRVVSINGPLTVTFTAASGATPVVFSDEACTTTIALPATVADGASDTFFFASPGAYVLSVETAAGVQIAHDLNTTRIVAVYTGNVGVFSYDARLVAKDFSGDSGRHSPSVDISAATAVRVTGTPANGDSPVYDGASGLWVPGGGGGLSSPTAVYTASGSDAASWTPTGVAVGDIALFAGITAAGTVYEPGAGWVVLHDGEDNTGFFGNRTVIAAKRLTGTGADSVPVSASDGSNTWLVMYLRAAASVTYQGFGDKTRSSAVAVPGCRTTATWPILTLVSGSTTSGMAALSAFPAEYSTQVESHSGVCYARLGFAATDVDSATLTVSDLDHVVYSLACLPN